MNEPWSFGAVHLASLIARRKISATEVVDACIRRIEDANGGVNAVVTTCVDRARREAREADARMARGEPGGPFDGVPFTVKDVVETEGVVTTAGLPERARTIPEHDAVVVARLRAAGAILLGKTNTPPNGSGGVTDNEVFGRTDNPYDVSRWVAGSSGGEAAAQAIGASAFGIGSDSGGSLRVPAHACGVAALKPTTGRVPNTGVVGHPGGVTDIRTQVGPMSRHVEDLLPILAVIGGPDDHDSGVVPMPLESAGATVERLRVAAFVDDPTNETTAETRSTVAAAAAALDAAGAVVVETGPKDLGRRALDISRRYWRWDELSGEQISDLVDEWDALRSDVLGFMRSFDVLVCPAAPSAALPHGEGLESMFIHTLPYSLTGQPCVVVRGGTSPEGLPIGVQVVARVWRDEMAIAAALAVERASGGWSPPL
jgi:amidase